jgi:hypothetical protein
MVLWHTDPFLGNDLDIGSSTTAVTMQQILNKQQLNYNKRRAVEKVFSTRSMQGVVRGTIEARFEHCKGVCDEKTKPAQLERKLKNFHC